MKVLMLITIAVMLFTACEKDEVQPDTDMKIKTIWVVEKDHESAVLRGEAENVVENWSYGFDIGKRKDDPEFLPLIKGESLSFTHFVQDLEPDTQYYFRAVGSYYDTENDEEIIIEGYWSRFRTSRLE